MIIFTPNIDAMRFYVCLVLMLTSLIGAAQKLAPLTPVKGEVLPAWAIEMYSDNPNVWSVDDGYRAWRKANPDAKTTFSQFYKKWRRAADPNIDQTGFISAPSVKDQTEFSDRLQDILHEYGHLLPSRGANQWTVVGPKETFNVNQENEPKAQSSQVNVYSFTQEPGTGIRLFCGT
jgi:hypothetical protein